MKKLYCTIFSKFREFGKPKISYLFTKTKTIVLCIICSKCKNEDEKLFFRRNKAK